MEGFEASSRAVVVSYQRCDFCILVCGGGDDKMFDFEISCKCTCLVCATKRERRCAGTCPYSDFDCGAFSTWTGFDELVSDPESLVTN